MTALETAQEEKMKGTAYRSLIGYFQSINDLEILKGAMIDQGINPNLILASSWYDARAYMIICEKCASMIGYSLERLIIEVSEYSAYADLNGIYKFLMKVAGTRMLLSKIPRLASSYTNYIRSRVVSSEQGEVILEFTVPEHFNEMTRWNFQGAVNAILKINEQKLRSFLEIASEDFLEENRLMSRRTFKINYQ